MTATTTLFAAATAPATANTAGGGRCRPGCSALRYIISGAQPIFTAWRQTDPLLGGSKASEEGRNRLLDRAAQDRLIGEQFEFGPFIRRSDRRSRLHSAREQPFGQRRGTRAGNPQARDVGRGGGPQDLAAGVLCQSLKQGFGR